MNLTFDAVGVATRNTFRVGANLVSRCSLVVAVLILSIVVPALRAQGASPAPVPPTGPENPFALIADHATIVVVDIDKESDWYSKVLGFREAPGRVKRGDFQATKMLIPGFSIDLVSKTGSTRSKRGGFLDEGWFHLVLRTSKIDDLYKSLKANQVAVDGGPDPRGAVTRFTVHDPEGNEIEITAN